MPAEPAPGIAWLESPQTFHYTRRNDELSRPYVWCLPMFWLKDDATGATPMTVPGYAYDDPEWRPL